MAKILDTAGVRAFLLDIEGTTTPVAFVYETLFPYVRKHAAVYLRGRSGTRDFEKLARSLAAEHAADRRAGRTPPDWQDSTDETRLQSVLAYMDWLMNLDRKSTALKSLQGRIWEAGYREGLLKGAIYPDVHPAFRRWRQQGKILGIFSSGSIRAQKLLFSHTGEGDLTGLIDAHFDTTTGPKNEAASYTAIARSLDCDPPTILFVSDVTAELDAAREARMRTALCVRDGEPPATEHPVLQDLNDLSV